MVNPPAPPAAIPLTVLGAPVENETAPLTLDGMQA
jgi:hypothetical protein